MVTQFKTAFKTRVLIENLGIKFRKGEIAHVVVVRELPDRPKCCHGKILIKEVLVGDIMNIALANIVEGIEGLLSRNTSSIVKHLTANFISNLNNVNTSY